jgi:hypothetical protein
VLYPENRKLKISKLVNELKILIFERYKKCMPNNKSDTIEIQSGNYVQKRVKKHIKSDKLTSLSPGLQT